MIEHLATLIENFPGAVNQTHCFAHILNLVPKSILHQFDVLKKMAGDELMDFDDATTALQALTLEFEDNVNSVDNRLGEDEIGDENEIGDDDNDNNPGDGCDGMSEEKVTELEESLVPIWLMLTKVSKQKYLILKYLIAKHSFELLPMLSKTHQQSFSLSGWKRTLASRYV